MDDRYHDQYLQRLQVVNRPERFHELHQSRIRSQHLPPLFPNFSEGPVMFLACKVENENVDQSTNLNEFIQLATWLTTAVVP
jgi:hypothetical protein